MSYWTRLICKDCGFLLMLCRCKVKTPTEWNWQKSDNEYICEHNGYKFILRETKFSTITEYEITLPDGETIKGHGARFNSAEGQCRMEYFRLSEPDNYQQFKEEYKL